MCFVDVEGQRTDTQRLTLVQGELAERQLADVNYVEEVRGLGLDQPCHLLPAQGRDGGRTPF